jgi:hypothetical protein
MLIGTEKHPKGPSYKNPVEIHKNLSGILLSFKTPRPTGGANMWMDETPDIHDIFQDAGYEEIDEEDKTENRLGSMRHRLHSGSWEFRGIPVYKGYLGEVHLIVDVIRVDLLPLGESLFDPVVFAREIKRDIDRGYLSETHQGVGEESSDFTDYIWPNQLVPVNWQWLTKSGSDWIYYESQPLWRTTDYFCRATPIDQRHYLNFAFSVRRSTHNAGNPYRLAQRISLDAYQALTNWIFDSLKLKLSPQAQSQKASISLPSQPWPVFKPTPEQIKQAKYITYMWSSAGYRGKEQTDDHRAQPEDVAAFIDERLKPNPVPGSYAHQPQIVGSEPSLKFIT